MKYRELGKPALDEELREVVTGYLDRDIRFFAFDIVDYSPEKKTVAPLAYAFESADLYYPLKVTNLFGGQGNVRSRAFLSLSAGPLCPLPKLRRMLSIVFYPLR